MPLQHISTFLPNPIKITCKKVGVQYRDVPIDGKPHKTNLISDQSEVEQGSILRAIGGVCGRVKNDKTGESLLFISLPEVML